MPAVIFKTAFRKEWNVGGFLFYMSRPDAFKGKILSRRSEFYDYIEYMKNSDKSDGLFTSDCDRVDEAGIAKLKEMERQSLENKTTKWIGVISFDNDYLRRNGFIVGNILDTEHLKDCTRIAIAEMINTSKNISADNVYWSAAIHTNTDNVHIHFQLNEINYVERRGDMIESFAIEKIKSSMIRETLTKKNTPLITEIERRILVPGVAKSFSPTSSIKQLMDSLPETNKAWQYGRAKMQPYRSRIKSCVDEIIESDKELKERFGEYKSRLEDMSKEYRRLYGKRKCERSELEEYAVNQLETFYSHAGNKVLQEIYKIRYGDTETSRSGSIAAPVKRSAPGLIKKKYEELKENVDKALEKNDNRSLSAALNEMERFSEESTKATVYLAYFYFRRRKESERYRKKAETYMSKACDICDNDPANNFALMYAKLYAEKGNHKKAAEIIQAASDMNGSTKAKNITGRIALHTGQDNLAAKNFLSSAKSGDQTAKYELRKNARRLYRPAARISVQSKLSRSIKSAVYAFDRCANSIERLLSESERHLRALQNEYEYQQEQGGLYNEYEREY